jgi:hypothetical protein
MQSLNAHFTKQTKKETIKRKSIGLMMVEKNYCYPRDDWVFFMLIFHYFKKRNMESIQNYRNSQGSVNHSQVWFLMTLNNRQYDR